MDLGDPNKVHEIKTLKKGGEDEARKILERISKHVQPIMRKHRWRVKLLSEFCPKNPSLLGMNVGSGLQVKLRLRRPNRECDFFPFEETLDTMLHELCHNVHGPHHAGFYKLWDEIRKECEDLMAKGIIGTGSGFDLPGRRLGGFSHNFSMSSLRQRSLDAAEKRVRLSNLLPSGPRRLGGDSTIKDALSPIQAAAMAAERRLLDDIWCGSHACENGGEEENCDISVRSSGECSTQHAVPSRKRNHGAVSSSNQPYSTHKKSNFVDSSKMDSASQTADSPTSVSKPNHDAMHDTNEQIMWECGTCTLLNPPLAPVCKLCCTQKLKKTDGSRHGFWSCKFCTLENSVEVEKCLACGQWRFSNGRPVATRAPYLGT